MKKYIIRTTIIMIVILLVATFFVNYLGSIHSSGDYYSYIGIDELASDATHVVRVEVLDERVQRTNTWVGSPQGWPDDIPFDPYEITTVNRLRVLEVFKGDVETGDIMEVMQLGGRMGFTNLVNDRLFPLPIGNEVVLFMRSAFVQGRPAVLISPCQSIYRVAADGTFESLGVNSEYHITLTVNDLERIAEEFGGGGSTPTPPPINRADLITAITEAEAFDLDLFPDWDHAPFLYAWEVAITVRDNPLATQEQVDTAAIQLRTEMNNIGLIISGPYPIASGVVSTVYWTLHANGSLYLSPGTINWNSPTSPWHSYRQDIHRVIIEGPITAGAQLQGLFSDLSLVYSIQGLDYINTSAATMMYALFRNASSLTSLDLSSWDTRNVINMGRMFMGANNLVHLNINGWDTSRVQRMHHMFQEANSLTSLDVSDWDTSRVITMHAMFTNVRGITQLEVSSWNTSNVTDMYGIFRGATGLTTLDLSGWDTGRVINMGRMFQESNLTSVGNISGWNTGSAQRMHHMFQDATSLTNGTVDVSNWNTANVFTMHGMFQGATGFTSLDLSRWDTRSLDNARSMFEGATGLTSLNLTGWQTGNVTITYGIFRGTSSLSSVQGISNWDMSNVTNMGRMFQDTNMTIDDISNWNTSSATAMHGLFQNAMGVTSLDLSGWSTHNITNMSFMFSGAPLQQLTLGQNFVFVNLPNGPALRAGTWSNVGGTYILSSAELMAHHNANPMQNTWTIN
ncbi:MAG: BspA family leucine-rich repeat surface protein [Defluviitaleaceae bacterium]|nr:BspA family leucine-rich repeat surface protein [Defluviitaleaceae bacterium]